MNSAIIYKDKLDAIKNYKSIIFSAVSMLLIGGVFKLKASIFLESNLKFVILVLITYCGISIALQRLGASIMEDRINGILEEYTALKIKYSVLLFSKSVIPIFVSMIVFNIVFFSLTVLFGYHTGGVEIFEYELFVIFSIMLGILLSMSLVNMIKVDMTYSLVTVFGSILLGVGLEFFILLKTNFVIGICIYFSLAVILYKVGKLNWI